MNAEAATSLALGFGLVACRFSALFFALPLVGDVLPARTRVAVGLVIAAAVALDLPPIAAPLSPSRLSYAVLFGAAASELLVGTSVAFCLRALFSTVDAAGQVVGVQLGLSFAGSVDPLLREESIVTTRLMSALGWLGFLAVGGLQTIVGTLALSVRRIPPGTALTLDVAGIVRWIGEAIALSVRLALPVLAGMLILQLAMALVSRVVAELNPFSFAFPAMTLAGLLLLVLCLDETVKVGALVSERLAPMLGAAWRLP
ncbi:MAG: flagellar biosynthetic protein FliR [Deltaproteobacteria bacterium]|nr:flagellar biosynthetic protein FliR [Deltaproteobacteria bacterium]